MKKSVMRKIDSKYISVVIQGPVKRERKAVSDVLIEDVIVSIKKHFPEAEILLSTWENSDISSLDVSKIVLNKDPGSFKDINFTVRNFNRQLVSTREGIREASRQYVLKTRSDLVFTDSSMGVIDDEHSQNQLFKNKVTMSNLFVRKITSVPFLFHISDVVQFGTKDDLWDLWNLEVEKEADIAPLNKLIIWRFTSTKFRTVPEQALCLGWLKKHNHIVSLESPQEVSKLKVRLYDEILCENFSVINYKNTGITYPVHFFNSAYPIEKTIYSADDLLSISKVYSSKYQVKIRFFKVWFSKYILCFKSKIFYQSVIINLLFYISPSSAEKIFMEYRRKRGKI